MTTPVLIAADSGVASSVLPAGELGFTMSFLTFLMTFFVVGTSFGSLPFASA